MPGPIQRDSVSRCDDGNSIFSTIRNHQTPHRIPTSSCDKLIHEPNNVVTESAQSRLNREMLNKVETMGLRLPHDSFVAVVQVGKYMVLAIMLPPYLLVYGIPKWLITTAIPEIFLFVKVQFAKIGNFFQEWSNRVVDVMKGLIDQTLGEALRMMQQQGQRFMNHAAEMMNRMGNAFAKLAQNTANALSGPYNACKNAANKMGESLQNQMRRIESALDAAAAAFKQMGEASKGALDGLKGMWNSAANSLSNAFNSIATNLSAAAMWMANLVKNGPENAYNTAANLLSQMLEKATAFAKLLQEAAQQVSLKGVKERLENVKKKLSDKANEISERVSELYSKVSEKVEEAVKHAAQAIFKTVMATPQAALQTIVWIYSFLPERRRQQFSKFYQGGRRGAGHVVSLYKGTVRGIKAGLSYLEQAFIIIKNEILKWIAWILARVKDGLDFIISIPERVYEFGKKIYPHIRSAAGQVGYALQLFFALLWAVTVFGFTSLSNLLARYSFGLTKK
jgi:gas vesicle protein